MSKLPLEGIRVIDHGLVFAGPAATTMLGDMGAEVIRVESIQVFPSMTRGMTARPPRGLRLYPGYADNDPGDRPWDRSSSYHALNRNKYGITLDLSRPRGVEIYKRLVKVSDVIIENFSPGVMDRLGVGYSVLKEVKPDIIMISASFLGAAGPYKGYSGVGTTVDAISGMMILRGYPDDDVMIRTSPVWPDNAASGAAAFAALTALHYRNRTGKGQLIDLSQTESFIPHMGETIMDYSMNRRVAKAVGNRDAAMAPHGCYRCQGNDDWVTIAVSSDGQWQALCHAMGDPGWAKEDRFASSLSRWKNQDELNKLIEEWTRTRDRYEVMRILQKVGVPAAAVVRPSDLYNDPHLKERGFFKEVTHREVGTRLYPGMCFKFSRTPAEIRIPSNCLGEHNEYVYGEVLGMSKDDIAELEREQIIGDTYLPAVISQ